MSSQREIRLNAFDMNCVGHQSPGLWAHPRDRSWQYKDLEYWTDLARLLERGKFDGLFIADVLGVYDVLNGNNHAAIRHATQVPVNDPLALITPMALVTRAATEFFNALGASDTRVSKALDRHWRNARTVSSHNPVIYKIRNVGDWEVNGSDPTFIWQIGNGE